MAPWLSPRLSATARCGSPLSNRSRNNSRILRIDSLSAGILFPRCWAKGASLPSVENCRRRGPLHRHAASIPSTGFDDHDRPESVITFHRNTQLALPFAGEEGSDRVAALQEFGAVAPAAVARIGEHHASRI